MRTLFVIMASTSFPNSTEKREILKRCAHNNGWAIHTPSYDANLPSFDLIETKFHLNYCQLTIADLSDERPSCYYELGLAEALGRPTALFASKDTPIHQTASRNAVTFFADLEDFQRKINDRLVLD